jgi:hypothetical protein
VSKRLRVLNKPRRGSYELWAKALVLLVAFWCALVNMCVSTTCLGSLLSSIAMGATASFIGTCIQHDGSHGAFSTSSWLNTCAGWTLDMIGVRDLLASFFQSSFNLLSSFFQSSFNHLSIVFQSSFNRLSIVFPSSSIIAGGVSICMYRLVGRVGPKSDPDFETSFLFQASAFTWEIQHMLGHHPYTNLISTDNEAKKRNDHDNNTAGQVQESDPDVFSSFPFMRMHPSHARSWYHKYQHVYGPVLFSMMTLTKVFQQDFDMFNQKQLYHLSASARYGNNDGRASPSIVCNRVRFVAMKVLSMVYQKT